MVEYLWLWDCNTALDGEELVTKLPKGFCMVIWLILEKLDLIPLRLLFHHSIFIGYFVDDITSGGFNCLMCGIALKFCVCFYLAFNSYHVKVGSCYYLSTNFLGEKGDKVSLCCPG